MISYKLQDLQVFQVSKVKLHRLQLKQAKVEQFEQVDLGELRIYSSDQLHSIVSKLAILLQTQMFNLSCVFMQKENQQTPYNYSLNRVSFNNQSVLNITTQYGSQQNIKEIGPIPFFGNELEFINRFKNDETALIPKVIVRPYTIGELFDVSELIDIYVLHYQDVEEELKKQHLIIKSPEYLTYFKYLFMYKYFPCSQEGHLMIDTQYQLKFNEVQDYILTPQSELLFKNVELSHMTESIGIRYQLAQLEVDLVLIFDQIKMKEHQNIKYVQYLYIRDGVQFYIQKAHSEQLHAYNQFYEDILVFSMNSGLKCKINSQGLIVGDFKIPIEEFKSNHKSSKDTVQQQKEFVERLFNEFLHLLKQITQQFSQDSESESYTDDSHIRKESKKTAIQSMKPVQAQVEFSMNSKIEVKGLFITQDLLRQMVQYNKDILSVKQSNERVIITNMFLNKESHIELVESTESTSLFEMQSVCTPLAKLVVPSVLLYIVLNKGVQQAGSQNKDFKGSARLMTTDPYLYKQLKNNEQYGRLCKKNQQPIPVQKDDDEHRTTYQFYNFTHNTPQLYVCPANAPYLGFMVGKHQKDFCLPCCYPVRQDKSDKKADVTKTCFTDYKYSKDSEKKSDVNTYIFTNPQKFQVNRNTILHTDIQKFISNEIIDQFAWFVFTLKLPEYTVSQSERIESLIQSCAYLLNEKPTKIMDLMSKKMKSTDYSQTQYKYLMNKNDQLLSISHFEYVISQVVEDLKCNLLIIGDSSHTGALADIQCFGVTREESIIVQKKKHIYNPVVLGECESNRKINNTDHLIAKKSKIAGEFISKLLAKFEHQRDQRTHSIAKIMQRLKQQSDLAALEFQSQIINQQGFVQFIQLAFKFKKGPKTVFLLPVQPSLPSSSENIQISTRIDKTEDLNGDSSALAFILETIYKISPQFRILDGNGQMRGVLYNNLFFYSQDASFLQTLQIHPNINFNPLLINQYIVDNKFETIGAQTVNASLRFIYFSNIYRLMKLQYTYFVNNENQQLSDWTQIFSYCPLAELVEKINKLANSKRQSGLQELVKLKACLVADESQFFCDKKKLILPNEFKPYIDLLKRDVQRDASVRSAQLYQIMLQEFVFQDREGDNLQQGRID